MIAMHKQCHGALEDLLLDLEGVLGPGQLEQIGRLYTPPRPPKDDDKDTGAKWAKYAAAIGAAQGRSRIFVVVSGGPGRVDRPGLRPVRSKAALVSADARSTASKDSART
jgi:hypothetical protein